nr:hypothetical protein [uncultured Flavobacterium sp.]
MKDFLSKYPLYKNYLLLEDYNDNNQDFTTPHDFIGQTFEHFCEKEGSVKTFELNIDNSEYFGYLDGSEIPNENFKDGKLNYIFKAIGKCISCKDYEIYMLLNVYSDNPISKIKVRSIRSLAFSAQNKSEKTISNIYIQKIGFFPEIKVHPNKDITKYFDRESNILYFKGINALSQNFGIGSFAYFRRIIEKELINIIKDIKTLPDSHSAEIEKLLEKHNLNPKISTIYDNIFEHLPNSLKSLGDNPIKLLYNQTSEGLHSLSEEVCLEKAKNINLLLDFVIKKINEERSEINDLRKILKDLK